VGGSWRDPTLGKEKRRYKRQGPDFSEKNRRALAVQCFPRVKKKRADRLWRKERLEELAKAKGGGGERDAEAGDNWKDLFIRFYEKKGSRARKKGLGNSQKKNPPKKNPRGSLQKKKRLIITPI